MNNQDKLIEAIRLRPSKIREIPQTYELCLAAVQKDGRMLKYVKNKTLPIMIAALDQNINVFKDIVDPCDDIIKYALSKDGKMIYHLENKTDEYYNIALEQNGYIIADIKNPTEEQKLTAVKQDGFALKFIKNPSDEIIKAAINQNPSALKFVTNKTAEIIHHALNIDPTLIDYVNNPSNELIMEILHKDATMIKYIKNPTLEHAQYVLETDPSMFQYINFNKIFDNDIKQHMDEYREMIKLALKEMKNYNLIDEEYITDEILEHIKNTDEGIAYFNRINEFNTKWESEILVFENLEEYKNDYNNNNKNNNTELSENIINQMKDYKTALEIVKMNGMALKHVAKQTVEIIRAAIQQNGDALRYVKHGKITEIDHFTHVYDFDNGMGDMIFMQHQYIPLFPNQPNMIHNHDYDIVIDEGIVHDPNIDEINNENNNINNDDVNDDVNDDNKDENIDKNDNNLKIKDGKIIENLINKTLSYVNKLKIKQKNKEQKQQIEEKIIAEIEANIEAEIKEELGHQNSVNDQNIDKNIDQNNDQNNDQDDIINNTTYWRPDLKEVDLPLNSDNKAGTDDLLDNTKHGNKILPAMITYDNWPKLDYNLDIDEIIRLAIDNKPKAIRFVIEPSNEIQKYAIERDPKVLKYIKTPTEEAIRLAITKDANMIMCIENQTEELMLLAINSNPQSIRYIINPTIKVVRQAIEKDATIINAIPSKTILRMMILDKLQTNAEATGTDACSICLEDLEGQIYKSSCEHEYHLDCIKTLVDEGTMECHMCKKTLIF